MAEPHSQPPNAPRDEHGHVTTRIEIPGRTFVNAAVAIVLTLITLWLIRELASVLIVIALALLVAGVMSGLSTWLQHHGVKKGLAPPLSMLTVVLLAVAIVLMVLPPLITQTSSLIDHLPEYTARLQEKLTPYPMVFDAVNRQVQSFTRDPTGLLTGVARFGVNVVSAVLGLAMILTLALYFLVDRDRVLTTIMRLTPQKHREHVMDTITESGRIMRQYVIGQAIVSSIFATYTFVVLTVLDVPYALVIAVAAFFLDAIPSIGAMLATAFAALAALSVSMTTLLIVIGAFLVYQQVENNMIGPRIMSKRLKVPPILTLLMVLVGGRLMGVVGVFIAIPIAGMLPVIERVWIRGEKAARPGTSVADEPPQRDQPHAPHKGKAA